MKKTYTTGIILSIGLLLFQYGKITGSGVGSCTRHAGYGALNNNPSNCAGTCHGGGGVVTDSTSTLDTTGIHHGNDTTSYTTGLADIAFRQGVSVYPTVTTGSLCVATTAESRELIYGVYTLDGRVVASGMLPDYASVTYLDVRALAPAQYIIRVANAEHSTSYHIIKQ